MKLEDKVAVITGAGSGIGYEMATLFAREGARIMGADVDADGLATTLAAVEAIGRPMRTFVADVTDPNAVEHLMAETVEAFGSIDILCNNAGIGHVGSVLEVTPEEWDRVMAVNVRGVYLGCKYAVPYMLAQGGGIIVNTASVAGSGRSAQARGLQRVQRRGDRAHETGRYRIRGQEHPRELRLPGHGGNALGATSPRRRGRSGSSARKPPPAPAHGPPRPTR